MEEVDCRKLENVSKYLRVEFDPTAPVIHIPDDICLSLEEWLDRFHQSDQKLMQ